MCPLTLLDFINSDSRERKNKEELMGTAINLLFSSPVALPRCSLLYYNSSFNKNSSFRGFKFTSKRPPNGELSSTLHRQVSKFFFFHMFYLLICYIYIYISDDLANLILFRFSPFSILLSSYDVRDFIDEHLSRKNVMNS